MFRKTNRASGRFQVLRQHPRAFRADGYHRVWMRRFVQRRGCEIAHPGKKSQRQACVVVRAYRERHAGGRVVGGYPFVLGKRVWIVVLHRRVDWVVLKRHYRPVARGGPVNEQPLLLLRPMAGVVGPPHVGKHEQPAAGDFVPAGLGAEDAQEPLGINVVVARHHQQRYVGRGGPGRLGKFLKVLRSVGIMAVLHQVTHKRNGVNPEPADGIAYRVSDKLYAAAGSALWLVVTRRVVMDISDYQQSKRFIHIPAPDRPEARLAPRPR